MFFNENILDTIARLISIKELQILRKNLNFIEYHKKKFILVEANKEILILEKVLRDLFGEKDFKELYCLEVVLNSSPNLTSSKDKWSQELQEDITQEIKVITDPSVQREDFSGTYKNFKE